MCFVARVHTGVHALIGDLAVLNRVTAERTPTGVDCPGVRARVGSPAGAHAIDRAAKPVAVAIQLLRAAGPDPAPNSAVLRRDQRAADRQTAQRQRPERASQNEPRNEA